MHPTHYLRTYLTKLLLLLVLVVPLLGRAPALADEGYLGQEKVLFRIDKVRVLGNRKVEREAILE